jgi:hypothetical protein
MAVLLSVPLADRTPGLDLGPAQFQQGPSGMGLAREGQRSCSNVF